MLLKDLPALLRPLRRWPTAIRSSTRSSRHDHTAARRADRATLPPRNRLEARSTRQRTAGHKLLTRTASLRGRVTGISKLALLIQPTARPLPSTSHRSRRSRARHSMLSPSLVVRSRLGLNRASRHRTHRIPYLSSCPVGRPRGLSLPLPPPLLR